MASFPLPLLAPALLFLTSALAVVFAGRRLRPRRWLRLIEASAVFAFIVSILSAALVFFVTDWTKSATAGGLLHVDQVSVIMLVLVSFIGWVVIRFSFAYLDGEANQASFIGRLAAATATVLLLVQAGHLAVFVLCWIATSLLLHRLLLHYPDRPAARRAARKKFVLARVGDSAIVLAAILLFADHGTGDISTIISACRAGEASGLTPAAAFLLALAALQKSAQFPVHGWLIEVVETPTPVSALLHAGIINAGGFLLIRFADVMLLAPGVLATLVAVGGFTALFASLAMLTQPVVKTSLAWSTVAQMGFLILQCGLALFPLALLHIVAHSLYKAHSFLSSGGAVEAVARIDRPGPVAVPDSKAVLRSFALALAIYGVCAVGIVLLTGGKSPQALALGAILIFGVAYLIAQGMADAAPKALALRTGAVSIAVSIAYFTLQAGAKWLTEGVLPPAPDPEALEWCLVVLAVFSFGFVALAQACFPLWSGHPSVAGLRVHLANGFYANAILDRLLGSWKAPARTSNPVPGDRT